MTGTARDIMRRLYGHDIWNGFKPIETDEQVQGWNGNHPSLRRLVSTPKTKLVVDVGVWKGQSTINMARSIQNAGLDGCVIAVDTWLGSVEHWKGSDELFNRRHGHPNLYDIFLSNVVKAKLTDLIVPMPQTSLAAALLLQQLGITAAVVHIDAAHDYEDVIRDATAYWAILEPGGYLIGDDYHESWPGVVRAAGEFSASVGRALSIEAPKWILQKS